MKGPHHSPECPVYLMVSVKLAEEPIPVLLVVVDTEVPSDIDVQQEPGGAEREVVVGVWEGDRRLCQSCTPSGQGGPGSAPTSTTSLGTPSSGRWQQDPHSRPEHTIPETLVSQ